MIPAESLPNIPRPEYPRPQFQRAEWINLNGQWTFTFDLGRSGMERGLQNSKGFDRQITVPFCPESILSGVQHTDFIEMMWYHRKLSIPTEWQGKHAILHFGGVDYECEIFIDGQSAGRHWGGTASINFDITHWVTPGREHDLVVYVRDEVRSGVQPGGKQSREFKSHDCDYTRTTGIWQTVWMEPVDALGLQSIYIVPDLEASRFIVTPTFFAVKVGQSLRVSLREPGDSKPVSVAVSQALSGAPLILLVPNRKLWSPESPFLYDLDLEVLDEKGAVIDHVTAYAGLRKVHTQDGRVYLNNQPICLERNLTTDQINKIWAYIAFFKQKPILYFFDRYFGA